MALAATVLTVLTGAGAPRAQNPDREISLEARSSEIDRRNDRLVFNDVVITQGDLGIEAGLAVGSGLSFENSDWTFSRNVTLTSNGARILAQEAVLSFRSHQLVRAELTGSPVTFQRESTRMPGRLTRGHAARADYDLETGSVRLSGDAWLCEGSNEIESDTIVYDLTAERVLADSGTQSDGRVRILITPSDEADGDAEPCTAPPFPAPAPEAAAPEAGGDSTAPPAPAEVVDDDDDPPAEKDGEPGARGSRGGPGRDTTP